MIQWEKDSKGQRSCTERGDRVSDDDDRGDPAPPVRVMIARRDVLRLGRALLAWPLMGIVRRAGADPLTESAAELEERTQEYQDTLGRLRALAEEALTRAAAALERSGRLHADGLIARRDVEEAERAVAEAESRLEERQRELAAAEQMTAEVRARRQLAAAPAVPPGEERATPEVVEYHGVSAWTLGQVADLERFFGARFGRALPVSALGQTPLHDRLGFDHRNAVDVAVHPDSNEGRALLDHLRARRIPFLAFRGQVARASTGAHVHVGPPSPRVG